MIHSFMKLLWLVVNIMIAQPGTLSAIPTEHCVIKHFNKKHSHAADRRFVVTLHRNPAVGILVESRSWRQDTLSNLNIHSLQLGENISEKTSFQGRAGNVKRPKAREG